MYCLPYAQFTIAFARDVFEKKKDLLENHEVRHIKWPCLEEISVKRMWPEFCQREECKKYFPDSLPVGRTIDKDYFFNVLNSTLHDELQQILRHALN